MDRLNNKKQIAIVLAGKELFWKYGFRRVTIEEICREAGASKMTFYRFYPNKLELARSVFDMAAEEGMAEFRKIFTEEISASEKMRRILHIKFSGTNEISNEFINDFYNNPELGLKPHIEEKTNALWNESLELFRLGQAEGWIRKDMNIEFMFMFMQRTIPLISDKAVLRLFETPQDLIMELANMFIYGISPSQA